jgi:hypothetical protein
MSVWRDLDGGVRSWGLLDTKLAQIAAFFLALVIAKAIPAVLSVSVWWFVGLAVLCGVKPTVTFFREWGRRVQHV